MGSQVTKTRYGLKESSMCSDYYVTASTWIAPKARIFCVRAGLRKNGCADPKSNNYL